jgi:hypothetical protein
MAAVDALMRERLYSDVPLINQVSHYVIARDRKSVV